MKISVVGGVYKEISIWPERVNLLGSAGRAADCISNLSAHNFVRLHSELHLDDQAELIKHFAFKKNVNLELSSRSETPTFEYIHPLATPKIYPSELIQAEMKLPAITEEDTVVLFGMIDRTSNFIAKTIIYDPQDSKTPKLLSKTNASAKNIVYILNQWELRTFYEVHNDSNSNSITEMANWLLQLEKASLVIVKCGVKGAFVCSSTEKPKWIQPYESKEINPIGSGDCFVAAFTHYYCSRKLSASQAAQKASFATAFYCENGLLVDEMELENYEKRAKLVTKPTGIRRKVYLAGPFFSLQQMWMINQAKTLIESFDMDVYSPYHELGIGPAEIVAPEDLKAIDNCDAVYALMEGNDPGTLFEIGYAIKANKKVVIYTENNSEESLKMYAGAGCIIEKDFATSIYKLGWS